MLRVQAGFVWVWKRNVIVCLLSALGLVFATGAPANEGPDAACKNLLPEKIAGAYSGWFSPHATGSLDELAETVLDPMAEAGFNTWYHKIQPSGARQIDLSDPAQFERVRLLAEACQERGLALVAYTYHYPHGYRDPKRYGSFVLDYPPLVTADGTVLENRFAMANWDTWLMITSAVFELAEASLELPIAAVGFDHEHFGRGTISYDDEAWADFAAERGLEASLAPEARGRFVKEQNLDDAYEQWYHRRWDDIVKRWVEKIHGINPHLSIAIMPQNGRKNWFGMPFFRHAGTEKAPAVMDCWHLYNGSGLTEAVKQIHKTIKEFNLHNRHVQWFRPDSYRTSDLRVHAYHVLWELDGYSNWHVGQITGADNPEDYWRAYRDANRAALRDIAAGIDEPSVPLEPITPVVAPMPELDDPIPQLVPRGDGSGDDRWIPMRNLRQVLIYARADEELRGEVQHRAGAARPLALHYRLVHPDGSWLYDNSVMPGETGSFSVRATETGTYALYVTGGMGGQAWYAVRIHNLWHAVPFEFGEPYIFYQRRLFPLTLWLQRRDSDAAASIRVYGSGIKARAGGGPAMAGRDFTLELPGGNDPIPVHLSRPQPGDISGPWHPQDIHLGAEDAVFPYLGVAPERMLLPEE